MLVTSKETGLEFALRLRLRQREIYFRLLYFQHLSVLAFLSAKTTISSASVVTANGSSETTYTIYILCP